MPAFLTLAECQSVHQHIQSSPLKLSNLHTRNTYTVRKERVLRHLNGMVLQGGVISGFVSGPGGLSIEYDIDSTGQVTINGHSFPSIFGALDHLNKYVKKEILERVEQGHPSHRPKLTEGHYYLRRAKSPKITKAAAQAVADGQLSSDFIHRIQGWNLRVIVGGGA